MDLCFVDVETTGLDPVRHELIEIAAVRVDPHTLEPLDHVSVKVRPERLANADPRALEVNGDPTTVRHLFVANVAFTVFTFSFIAAVDEFKQVINVFTHVSKRMSN